MNVLNPAYTLELDANDRLAHFRKEFNLPVINGKQTLYFTGNSLGLMPKLAEKYLSEEIEDWKKWPPLFTLRSPPFLAFNFEN